MDGRIMKTLALSALAVGLSISALDSNRITAQENKGNAATLGKPSVALAQGKGEKKEPPQLPPTKVEVEQKAPSVPPPPEPPAPVAGNPLSNGGVFGSPRVDGYRAESATTGSKVDMPLIDYPGTLSVIPLDLVKDQSALRIDDLLRDIPAAAKLADFANLRDAFLLRGFEIGSRDIRWNGFPDPSYIQRDFANIQRVEVLSGPSSVLYGSDSPAGLINFITKKPLATPYNNAEFTFGSFNLTRYAIDSTGPVDEAGRVSYRLNAAYQQNDSFRDFGWDQRTIVAPVVTVMLGENTSLTFEGSYQDQRRHLDTGLIFLNGAIQGPINRSYNEPGDWQSVDDYKGFLSLNHRFDDCWSGRLMLFTDGYNSDFQFTGPADQRVAQGFNQFASGPVGQFLGLQPLTPTEILRQTQAAHLSEQFYDLTAEMNGKFDALVFKHNVVFGSEFGWYHSNFTARTSDPVANPFAPSVFNFANPMYNQVGFVTFPGSELARIMQERVGLYASDAIELNEHWKLLAGVRYDIVHTDAANSLNSVTFGQAFGFPTVINDRTDYHISPRVGLVYQPIPELLSFYGTFMQSFDPPLAGIFTTPTPLLPETGTSGEIGVKADIFEKRLSLQAAGYIIDKQHVVAQENLITSTQIGEIRGQGAIFSVVGKLTSAWSIVGNYSYTDSRIVSANAPGQIGSVGDRFRNVPYNTFNVWTRYNLIDTDCHTLGVGLGFIYVGDRFGDLDNTFALGSYSRWDAGIYYKRNHLNASVYFENLAGRTYYVGSFDNNTIFPGAPFNVRATLGVTF